MQLSGAINVATDVVLLLFPLPLLTLIKFNKRQRSEYMAENSRKDYDTIRSYKLAALAVILSIGLIPVVASTMRLCEIIMSGSTVSKGQTWQDVDSSWTWAWVPVWSQIEVDVGIIAASLPCLSPLLKLAWSGFSTPRAGTPSQVPTIPGYRGSWAASNMSKNSEFDVEKMEKLEENGYFDNASGAETQIGVAKTADARIAMRMETSRISYARI